MLTHPALDQLRALKLDGMVRAFIELEAQEQTRNLATPNGWPCCSTASPLIAAPAASKPDRAARLRHSQAAIEDVDYRTPRRFDKALLQHLATCRWILEDRLRSCELTCAGERLLAYAASHIQHMQKELTEMFKHRVSPASVRYPRSEPDCMTRPVSEHDQHHIRSPRSAAAP